jgi:CheY-like chemotaxis protein
MSLLVSLAPHLPYVRRYARALTGDQAAGDQYVRASLEALAAGDAALDGSLSAGVALYRVFHVIWETSGAKLETHVDDPHPAFQNGRSPTDRLLRIAPRSRQAFLLTAVEGFSPTQAAQILDTDVRTIEALIAQAQSEIDAELATSVLIIEDEAVIAADIEALVKELGHGVTGIAATREQAAQSARRQKPGLVLCDIQLADGSSGIDAARDILAEADVPVIFITAFPERLLTGEGLEPTYLITKPFQPEMLKAAIGQALFFHPRGAGQADGDAAPHQSGAAA